MKDEEIKDFLKQFSTKDGKPMEIPLEGSLGLLAFGDLGYLAWQLRKQQQSLQSDNEIITEH